MSTAKPQMAKWRWFESITGKRDGSIVLTGKWANDSKRPRINGLRYPVVRIREDFSSATLDCLRLFPDAKALDISSFRVTDLAGLYSATRLEKLWISRVWPKHIELDFARLSRLRTLSVHWTKGLRNQGELVRLSELCIHGCEGVKMLDLSGLKSLRKLLIGPAKGVETLSLERVPTLQHLSLALMPRLRHILGTEFLDTVTHLDLRGSDSIPSGLVTAFTKLRVVEVGMRSRLDPSCFGDCKPTVVRLPV